jgi:hypothetical protein
MARKTYMSTFKEQAVKLNYTSGKSVAETASDLGLPNEVASFFGFGRSLLASSREQSGKATETCHIDGYRPCSTPAGTIPRAALMTHG